MQAIQVRKELTDEWQDRGVQKGVEFAILTCEITKAWSGMSTRQYKNLKGLKKENLRDNMSTTEISKTQQPQSFEENRTVVRRGGKIANEARVNLENAAGKSVITSQKDVEINGIVTDLIEGMADDMKDKKQH